MIIPGSLTELTRDYLSSPLSASSLPGGQDPSYIAACSSPIVVVYVADLAIVQTKSCFCLVLYQHCHLLYKFSILRFTDAGRLYFVASLRGGTVYSIDL